MERRKRHEQHKVACNLNYTRQNYEGRISTQLSNDDLLNILKRIRLNNFDMLPLLSKKPSNKIILVATKDAATKAVTSENILNGLLNIKKDI